LAKNPQERNHAAGRRWEDGHEIHVHTYKALGTFFGKPKLPQDVADLFSRIAPSRKKK